MNSRVSQSAADNLINEMDKALRAMFVKPTAQRPSPSRELPLDSNLEEAEIKSSIELMRINHTGEVCAQALYQGQALTAKSADVAEKMQQAAQEEIDHLDWCHSRLDELGGRPSRLNPLWYLGSLTLGAVAGRLGDKWSLGFLEETERQVEQHLADHMQRLPENDHRSRAIVTQMKIDEAEHAEMAHNNGAAELPQTIKKAMNMTAALMKTVAGRI